MEALTLHLDSLKFTSVLRMFVMVMNPLLPVLDDDVAALEFDEPCPPWPLPLLDVDIKGLPRAEPLFDHPHLARHRLVDPEDMAGKPIDEIADLAPHRLLPLGRV